MIHVDGLVKVFDGRRVLRGIDLELDRGRCLAIMGPNGAGKTTLLRILATLTRPTEGLVRIDGLDVATDAQAVRGRIGFVSHQPLLYDDLSAEENLRFYGRMYGVSDLCDRAAALLDDVGLRPRRYDLVRTFSRGMRQRLAIARVLLHAPNILLMDEPYTGLDHQARETLDRLFQESAYTIVLTTHDVDQGLRVADRAAVLIDGRLTAWMGEEDWDPEGFCRVYQGQVRESHR